VGSIAVRSSRGQAAIEAIAGALVMAVAALVIWQVILVLAAASAAQADARRAGLAAPAGDSLQRITRQRAIDAGPPWLPGVSVEATAATR
jgi:hypothetical protein